MPRLWLATLLRIIAVTVLLTASLWAAVAYFPTFMENFEAIKKLAVLPVMREKVEEIERGGVWAYMAGQQFFKGCNTMGVAAAVLFAVGAVAGESERGTFEVWLARPVSRRRLLLERWFAGALAVCIPVFISTYALNVMMSVSGVDAYFPYPMLTLASVHQCLLLLAIYTATFFFSVIGHNPIRIAFGMLFFGMTMFSIYLVETITKWSLFRLSDPDRYMWIQENMSLQPQVALPLLAAVGLFLGLSLWRFGQRVP